MSLSVDLIEQHGVGDHQDRELLVHRLAAIGADRAVATSPSSLPPAGVPLEDIDKVVSFFQHRNRDFSVDALRRSVSHARPTAWN